MCRLFKTIMIVLLSFVMVSCGISDDEKNRIDDLLSSVRNEHVNFIHHFDVTFENSDDKILFEKRIEYLGMDIVSCLQNTNEYEYIVKTHYKVETRVFDSLDDNIEATINAKDIGILKPSDVVSVRYSGIALKVVTSEEYFSLFTEEYSLEGIAFVVNGVSYEMDYFTNKENTITFMNAKDGSECLEKTAMALAASHFNGNVLIKCISSIQQ